MSARFRFGPAPSGDPRSPWFRVGTLEVTTSVLAAALGSLGMIAYAVAPTALLSLALIPEATLGGQIWRLVTWPIPNGPSLWTVLALVMLWYFGSRLEEQIGRARMLTFLALSTVALGLLALPLQVSLAGVVALEFVVFLLFCAEHPQLRFFFGIPAWALALVYVAITVLQQLAARDLLGLAHLLLGFVVCAVLARAVGLLTDYPWIPGGRRQPRARRAARGGTGSVVVGPWADVRDDLKARPTANAPVVDKDTAELDALLDKIHAEGLGALSKGERKRLDHLREKRRGPG